MRQKLAIAVIGVAGAVVVASGGMAVAAYSGVAANGQILACWQNSKAANLRIVDHFPCKAGETAISWNQKGVKGDRGVAGVAGVAGAAGEAGPAGVTGATGAAGVGGVGSVGPAGPAGADGAPGVPGVQGLPGVPGEPGEVGPAGSALSVYDGETRLGMLMSATRSQVHYLDDGGVIQTASPTQVVTSIMFSQANCQGTAYLYQSWGTVAGDFRVDDDIHGLPAGSYTRAGEYTNHTIGSIVNNNSMYGNFGACQAYNADLPTAPIALLPPVEIR